MVLHNQNSKTRTVSLTSLFLEGQLHLDDHAKHIIKPQHRKYSRNEIQNHPEQ